jgi:hypothetical protein
MGGITEYKPVDDGAGTTDNWYTTNHPMGAAIGQRFANNSSWLAQNRLNKSSKTWDCTDSSDTSTSTFKNSAGDSSKILGYTGNVGGASASDTDTIGFQFSTHPGAPLAMPLGWRLSPGAGKIKVRLTMEVLNATGSVYAALVNGDGGVYPASGFAEVDRSTYSPLVAGNFFNAEIRAADSYAEVDPTSGAGTSGYSYYELDIDLARFSGSVPINGGYDDDATIVLFFQSGVDVSSAGTHQVGAGPSAALTTGNRVLRTTSNMSKYANNTNPGKYHKVIKIDYTDASVTETWHHIVQLRPHDVTVNAFAVSNSETFVLWPSIPPAGVPPSLVGGGGGTNTGALEDTGLLNGDNFTMYDITQFNIFSVTVEEEYE